MEQSQALPVALGQMFGSISVNQCNSVLNHVWDNFWRSDGHHLCYSWHYLVCSHVILVTHKIQMETIRRYCKKIYHFISWTFLFFPNYSFTFVVTLFYMLLPVLAGTQIRCVCASLNLYCCSVVEVQAPAKHRNKPTLVLQNKGAVSCELMLHKTTKELTEWSVYNQTTSLLLTNEGWTATFVVF